MELAKSLIVALLGPAMLIGLVPPSAVNAAEVTQANNSSVSQSQPSGEAANATTSQTPSRNDAGSAPVSSSGSSSSSNFSGSPSASDSTKPQQSQLSPEPADAALKGAANSSSQSQPSPPTKSDAAPVSSSRPSVGPQDAVSCTAKANQTWGTLHWNIHLSDDRQDCVLELEHGTIPDTGKMGDNLSSPINYKSTEVTQLVVDKNTEDPVKLTSGWGIFDGYFLPNLKTADVGNLDTSSATLMGWMFHDLAHLETITGTGTWDTHNVTDMTYMFLNDTALTELDISSWDMSRITQAHARDILDSGYSTATGSVPLNYAMFQGMSGLQRLKIGKRTNFYPGRFEYHYGTDPQGSYWHSSPFYDVTRNDPPSTPYFRTADSGLGYYIGGGHGTNVFNTIESSSPWMYLIKAHYFTNGTGASVWSCNNYGDVVPNTPVCTTASRPGYQLVGWNSRSDGTGSESLNLEGTVPYPYKSKVNIWYAQWETVLKPTITSHTVKADGVHLSGTFSAETAAGDKLTVTDNTGQSSGEIALPAGTTSWNAKVPLPKDLVGTGGSMTYTAKVAGERAQDSAPYTKTIDAVAPGLESMKVEGNALKGTALSSGDNKAQTGYTVEANDTVEVTWPNNKHASAPSGSNGRFRVIAPRGASMNVKVKVKVTDRAGASGIGGKDNTSVPVELNLLNTVHFEVGSGLVTNAPDDKNVPYGNKVKKPDNDPEWSGHTFDGWYTDTSYDTKFDFDHTVINSNQTVYAKWTGAGHKVSFDSNGGSPIADETDIADGDYATEPVNPPTWANHRFLGWYTAASGGSVFQFKATPITQDTTVYAHWVDTFDVQFDSNGGSAVATQPVDTGKYAHNPGPPTTPATDGHGEPGVFAGWFNGSATDPYDFANTKVTAPITLTAHWRDAHHHVTFNTHGGSAVDQQSVADGGKPVKPTKVQEPTKAGERFDGWYTDGGYGTSFNFDQVLTSDVEVHAKWVTSWDVTFDSQGGLPAPDIQHVDDGAKADEPPAMSKTDHHGEPSIFLGWFDGSSTSAYDFEGTAVKHDTALTAHWRDAHHHVTFDTQGGTPVDEQNVADGGKATKPTHAQEPTKVGERFGGWYTDGGYGTPFDFNQVLTGDVTIHAKWVDTYTVTFVMDGGSHTDEQKVADGGYAHRPAIPTKAGGYRFDDWYTSDSYTTRFDFGATAITENTSVYAHWVKRWKVTVDPNNGGLDSVTQDTVDAGTQLAVPSTPAVPRDHHHEVSRFLGWYTASGAKYTSVAAVEGDVTLTAKWDDAHRKVTFETHGGSPVPASQLKEDGQSPDTVSDPTWSGYRFLGWYTVATGGSEFSFTQQLHSDVVAHAHWVKVWNVAFDTAGGSTPPSAQTVNAGTPATPVADPTAMDHHGDQAKFLGWYAPGSATKYDFATPVTGDLALTAKWRDARHKITLKPGNGDSDIVNWVDDGDLLAKPEDPVETGGYRFDGWYTAQPSSLMLQLTRGMVKFDFTAVPTEDISLYGRFVKTWNVTFDPAGGTGQPPAQVVDQDEKATRPAAEAVSRTGYVLAGWLDAQGRDYGFDTPVTADVNLTAKWAVDKTGLNALIEQAKGKNKSDYTSDSFKPLQDALGHAQSISDDSNASKADVDKAADALQHALNSLKPVGSDGSNGSNGSNGTNGANGAVDSDSASGPNGANGMNGSNGANGAVDSNGSNDSNSASGPNGANGSNGTNGSSSTSSTSSVNNGSNGSSSSSGANNGSNGSSGASGANGVNSSNGSGGLAGPNGLIDQAEAVAGKHRQSDYTPGSWKAFLDALNHAKAVAADPNASRSDIDRAAAALRDAMNGLKRKNSRLSATGVEVVAPIGMVLVLTAMAGLALALRKREGNR